MKVSSALLEFLQTDIYGEANSLIFDFFMNVPEKNCQENFSIRYSGLDFLAPRI
jgi:hypothetical protein